MRNSSYFSALAIMGVATGSSPAAAQVSPAAVSYDLSDQARFACEAMLNKGEPNLVIMDKNQGELILTKNCKIVDKSPALYGKGKGESEIADPDTTPAGIFHMKEHDVDPRDYEGGKVLAFLINRKASYVIHPTYQHLPQQRRDQRLASPTPDDNAISFGCINIPTPFYKLTVSFLKANQTERIGASGPVIELPKLVILPKNRDFKVTASTLGF